ncbi:MAG: hypothetical protein AAF490_22660 [Chloroflexota bacterium]
MTMANSNSSTVIEIATFQIKVGVSAVAFNKFDQAVQVEHVSKQPGFISRETAVTETGAWLVIVHWQSVEDAEASMASFGDAPAAAQFMANLDASTMEMKRYIRN